MDKLKIQEYTLRIIAIRHIKYDPKGYTGTQDQEVLAIRNYWKGRGYNTTENAWIGKKSFSEFGMNEDEIVSEIVSEINDIVELFRKTIC